MIRPALLTCCLFLTAMAHAGDMYEWKDKEGNPTYSDQPPPNDVKETLVKKRVRTDAISHPVAAASPGSTAPTAAPAQKTSAELEADFKKRQVEKSEADAKKLKEAEEAATKKKNCEIAKGQAARYERGGRITRTRADGEQEFLDENGIKEGLKDAKKAVDSWCNS